MMRSILLYHQTSKYSKMGCLALAERGLDYTGREVEIMEAKSNLSPDILR